MGEPTGYTCQELAAELGLSRGRVRNLRWQWPDLFPPPVRGGDGVWRYSPVWIDRHKAFRAWYDRRATLRDFRDRVFPE